MLDELAQPDAAGVRAHGHAELRGQQQVGEVLVDARDAAGVDLHDVDRLRLKELLEDHAIRHMLAGGDAQRADRAADRARAEDVVGAGRLLDPGRVEARQLADPRDRGRNVPDLVGVKRDPDAFTHRLTGDRTPPQVSSIRPPTLILTSSKPSSTACCAKLSQPRVLVAEPPGAVV